MGKLACIGERCRRWINTVCSVCWWLSQATSAPQRQARLQALRAQLRPRARLLPMFDDARLPVERLRRLRAEAANMETCWPNGTAGTRTSEALLRTRQSREERVSGFVVTRSISLPTNQRASASEGHETGYQAQNVDQSSAPVGPLPGIMRGVWDWNRRCSTRRGGNFSTAPAIASGLPQRLRKPCNARRLAARSFHAS